jgi:EmrB/QacA subfamily drug resistance transporter
MATSTATAGVRGGHAKHGAEPVGNPAGAPMTHRQIMQALTGLLLGLFVAILSSTVVTNALPHIIEQLGGGQSAYTWVVTAELLTMTATTPLWGKLADLFSKKVLVQISLTIYVLASMGAGLSQSAGMLIAIRVAQGVGVGGLSALAQIILAAMIPPRERGRYSGYLGSVFAVATVGGPLLGGVLTDTSWLGWRWCFYVGAPFAVIALILLQKTLHLPVVKRKVKVDWLGAFFISAGVSLLLVWVTFAGNKYDWLSWQTYAMIGGSIVLFLLFGLVETRASEPIVPLRLFRNRTITLASLASLFVGVAMFGGSVFFSQYYQLARGKSPTMSGVMTIPMIAGLFIASTMAGQFITRTGRWKAWLVAGGALLTAGMGLLGTIRYDTPYWQLAIYMALLGLGVGMMMQNLVLCTQNQVTAKDLGSASSVVAFFRSLGGAVGVSALGALLANRVTQYMKDGLTALGPQEAGAAKSANVANGIQQLSGLPAPLRHVMEVAYGHGVGDIFLYAAPAGLLAFLITWFIKEVPLRTGTAGDASQEAQNPAPGAGPAAVPAGAAEVAAEGPRPDGGDGCERFGNGADPAHAPGSVPAAAPTPADVRGTPVSGVVRGAESAPVAGAAVTLISLGGGQLARSSSGRDGGYLLDAPGAGSFVLIASADGYQPQAATVVVGGGPVAYDILLSGTSGLAGSVRAADGGRPVAGAMVIVTDVRGDVLASGSSDDGGGFAFTDLVPGPVTVAVNGAGFRPLALPVDIGGQGVTRVDAVLDAGASVQGTVRAGAGGHALPDARVTLVDAAGNVVATSTTGDDGAYAFTELNAGEYTIIATGYPPVAGSLTVAGRGVEGHDIELAHPGA